MQTSNYSILLHYLHTRLAYCLKISVILRNEIRWFDLDVNSTGSLVSNLAAGATLVRSTLVERLSTIVQNVALTLTAFTIAFTLSWRLTLVTMATFPLLIGASLAEQLFQKGFGGDYTSSYSRTSSLAREAIINIRTVAALGAEDRILSQFTFELNQPGLDIRGLNLKSLRLKIGLVQQELALFSTTVYENIQYGEDGASEIEVIEAANAHEFIGRMPDSYQTQVGERGGQLSGGQKQRVGGNSWAILKDPTILLLDEATNAIDSDSEKVVQEALD
ncbi:hypothetical protein GIB67_015727 [Kingdonia uniflora]|uniref:ABC transmembrane type-1 domain-containing protein n=1 Tax=Kingdonia uniflora TaxID=39325 RepID=A0A7J7NU88_9MAGN|nr:hypothetical protein GIB67_015727 [Kingdonia uniflora]